MVTALRVFLGFSIVFILISCEPSNDKNDYVAKYQKLIIEYNTSLKNNSNYNNDTERKIYEKYAQVPKHVYSLPYKQELVKVFSIGGKKSLPKYQVYSQPPFPSYPELYKVENNVFSFYQVQSETDEMVLYDYNLSRDMLENGNNNVLWSNSIFLEGEFKELIYDRKRDVLHLADDKNRVIIDYKEFLPSFQNCILSSPILDDNLAYFAGSFMLKLKNGLLGGSNFIYIYNWKEKKTVMVKILPGLNNHNTFYLTFGKINSKDSKDRIYFALRVSTFPGDPYPGEDDINGRREGSLLIYDPFKDVLYDLRHPFLTDKYIDIEILDVFYVIGVDNNIYYQIITNDYYLIYKITPGWDEKMEEIEYNPVFFEYAPKALQKEWERLKTEIKKE